MATLAIPETACAEPAPAVAAAAKAAKPRQKAAPPARASAVPAAISWSPADWLKPISIPATNPRDPQTFKRFDALGEPGLTTNFPPMIDTVLGDLWGWRSALAAYDIGVQSRVASTFTYDLLPTGQPNFPQRFNGQIFTLQNFAAQVIATAALDRYGLDHAKFVFGGVYFGSSADLNGPDVAKIKALYYYQSFFNKAVELKLGYVANYYEFIGLFTGGSPVLSSGLSGITPLQTGLSADPIAKPSAIVTLHGGDGFYVKSAVQQSTSPLGRGYEAQINSVGLTFSQEGAAPLVIGEVGLRRRAGADTHQIWLRAGAIYNWSDYPLFGSAGTGDNAGAYLSGDYQFAQIDPNRPFRGVYAGANYYWADPSVNVITQTYEARIYGIGLFDARPSDTISLIATYNEYSAEAQKVYTARKVYNNPDQFNLTLSYSYHAGPGIYVMPAIAWIRNPSFIGDFKDALNVQATLYLLL